MFLHNGMVILLENIINLIFIVGNNDYSLLVEA